MPFSIEEQKRPKKHLKQICISQQIVVKNDNNLLLNYVQENGQTNVRIPYQNLEKNSIELYNGYTKI